MKLFAGNQIRKNAKAYGTTRLSGTRGPVDRNQDLQLTTEEVDQALAEVRQSVERDRLAIFGLESATEINIGGEVVQLCGDTDVARSARDTLELGVRGLESELKQKQRVEGSLLKLRDVVDRDHGGTFAYLGAEFGARFGEHPVEVQHMLALSMGWLGVTKRGVRAQRQRAMAELETKRRSGELLKQIELPDVAAIGQQVVDDSYAEQERVLSVSERALSALE